MIKWIFRKSGGFMLGVFVNVIAILVGGCIGLVINKGLNENVKKVVMQAIGLSVLIIGISGAIETQDSLLLVMSLVIGGAIGAIIHIDAKLEKFGKNVEDKFGKDGGFAKGFVMATLIYTVGAMSILGSLQAGLDGDNTTLYIKSILDGVTAIIFTATLGYGVLFSAIPVLLFQGSIVLLSRWIEPFLIGNAQLEMSAVGSVIIVGIGITLLDIKKINLGDLLPSIFIPVIWYAIPTAWLFVMSIF